MMQQTEDKPFLIYRSSAGSGKTYTLALEYLKLALRGPQAYRSVLAVTFTNKATREMKTRIIEFLYGLSSRQRPDLLPVLSRATRLDEEALAARARQVLSAMLHGYSYFSVMTIDAFFQKVIRAFAREMGLQAGFALELEQEAVLDEVIDQLLAELGDEGKKQLREWLIRFSAEKVEAGKAWDFRQDIKRLAYELFKEDYKIRQQESGGQRTAFHQMLSELKAIAARFEKAMQSYGERGLRLIGDAGLDVKDFKFGKSGVAGYLLRLSSGGDYDPKSRARQAYHDPENWAAKNSPQKERIGQLVEQNLQAVLSQAVEHYDRSHQEYYSALQMLRFIYAHGLLRSLEEKLQAYKQENDLMLISDAGMFLSDIIGQEDMPFIYEKTGSSFQHFLIDEFQDTSGLQWANFRPLVENSLNEGHRNLVVGDVKQSIYRWRGGDWQLLLEKIQQDISPWHTEVRHLDRNYRSLREVVDFNNRLFKHLPVKIQAELMTRIDNLEEKTLRESLRTRLPIIRQAYRDASQQLPDTYAADAAWHGYVRIELLDRDDEDEETPQRWHDRVKERLPALVEELQDRGLRAGDIAFLVRDKKAGKEVVDTFMQYKNEGRAKADYSYELISSESLYLNTSLVVGLLIDLLSFLDRRDDALAKGSIAYKYHKLQGREISSDTLHHIFMTAAHPQEEEGERLFLQLMPQAFIEFYPYLNKLPLYELVENLIGIFELNRSDELAFLQAFQDAVLQFAQQESGDLHSFLQWWHEKGSQTSVQVAEDVDAMRILTIHKAKGLQFKAVILPFCDWELDHRRGLEQIIWTKAGEEPFSRYGLLPMRYGSALSQTFFSRDYYEEQIRAYMDNLNLLYVAFTRAETCLYAFASPKIRKKGDVPFDGIANALYLTLPELAAEHPERCRWDEHTRTFEAGSPPTVHQKPETTPQETAFGTYLSVRWRDRLSVRPYARHFFEITEKGALQPRIAVLLRDILRQLWVRKDAVKVLEKVFFERGLSAAVRQEVEAVLRQALESEPLASWFNPDQSSVHIGRPLFDGRGQSCKPDRLLMRGEEILLLQFFAGAFERKENREEVQTALVIMRQMGHRVQAYLYDTDRQVMEQVESS